jgi:hypothetical protein
MGRVGVRGNEPNSNLRRTTTPGTVRLCESLGESRGLPKLIMNRQAPDTRPVLDTAQGNMAAALVVRSQSFSDPKVVVMVDVVATVGSFILMPLSRMLAAGR